jgi:hypothetical protein
MQKVSLLAFSFFLIGALQVKGQNISSCEDFLADLRALNISASSVTNAPRLREKVEKENHFLLILTSSDGKEIPLKLIKSKTTKMLFDHISKSDILLKDQGSSLVRVYKVAESGALLGKNFDSLCP